MPRNHTGPSRTRSEEHDRVNNRLGPRQSSKGSFPGPLRIDVVQDQMMTAFLAPDSYDLQAITRQHYRLVAGTVGAAREIREDAREALPCQFSERPESFPCRAEVGFQDLQVVTYRMVAEHEVAPGGPEIFEPLTTNSRMCCLYPRVRAPSNREAGARSG